MVDFTQDFKADTQYNDWKGTAAADDGHDESIETYLKNKGLMKPGEILLAISLSVGENFDRKLGDVSVRAFLFDQNQGSVQEAITASNEPIPIRKVEVEVTLEEFVASFKRFEVILTNPVHSLENRQYFVRKR